MDEERCPSEDLKPSEGWKLTAGISTFCSMVLPLLNEFPDVTDKVLMGVGGTGAVAVGAILLRIANVTVLTGDMMEQQKEKMEEFQEEHTEKLKEQRQRRIDSDYLHDI